LCFADNGTFMPYTPILATLGYVLSPDRRRVLMIHRETRVEDYHAGKYNGLGGKLEANEDAVSGMRREIREEAGIECLQLSLRGTISWPGFGKHGEDWFGFLFLVTHFSGTPLDRNPEGRLEWIEIGDIKKLPLWDGDQHFLPLVFDADSRPFHGVMPFGGGRMLSWSYSRD
jgi:8-oxo-dGTP diphosphatase